MQNSYLKETELASLGVISYGKNLRISRHANLYSPELMEFGDNVRVDDFCILSGSLSIGSYVHIAPFCALIGAAGILMEDFSGISGRVLIYSSSDDYNGEYMTNPQIPEEYRKVKRAPVNLMRHSLVGAGCILLPGVTLEQGATIGAMSLVSHNAPEWTISVGIPAKVVKKRNRRILELESRFKSIIN